MASVPISQSFGVRSPGNSRNQSCVPHLCSCTLDTQTETAPVLLWLLSLETTALLPLFLVFPEKERCLDSGQPQKFRPHKSSQNQVNSQWEYPSLMNVKVKKHLIFFSPSILLLLVWKWQANVFYFLLLFSIIMSDSWSKGIFIILSGNHFKYHQCFWTVSKTCGKSLIHSRILHLKILF